MECKPGSQQKAAEHTYLYRAKFAKGFSGLWVYAGFVET